MGRDFENPFGQKAAKSGRTFMMSELLDKTVIPGIQGGALMHVVAAKAVGFAENLRPSFETYAREIIGNAQALAASLTEKDFEIVSGGTDNHLMLLDLRNKDWTGKAAQAALDEAGITCNKNAVPFDDKSPLITSGIRLGTPAVTTRGMGPAEMGQIASFVSRVMDREDPLAVRKDVQTLTSRFPIH